MADMYGYNAWLGVGLEAVWGTAATITDWFKIASEGLVNNVPYQDRESLNGPGGPDQFIGKKSSAGDVVLECLYQGMEPFLARAFGAPTIQANVPVTGAHTWTFSPQVALYDGKGMTLEATYAADLASIFAGCKPNSLTWNLEGGKVLKMTANMIGKSWAKDITPTTPSYPTDRPMLESELVFSLGPFSGAYAVVTNIGSATFTIDNKLGTDRPGLGSAYIGEPRRGDYVNCSGSWTGDFLGSTTKDYMEGFTPFKVKWVYTTSYYIVGTTPYSATFEFPKAYVTGDTPTIGSAGVIPETNNFKGVQQTDGTPAFRVILVTGRAALPAET